MGLGGESKEGIEGKTGMHGVKDKLVFVFCGIPSTIFNVCHVYDFPDVIWREREVISFCETSLNGICACVITSPVVALFKILIWKKNGFI